MATLAPVDVPGRYLAQLRELVASHPEIKRVILFGSRSRGTHLPRADVDLAFDAPTITSAQWSEVCEALDDEGQTLLKVDLLLLHNTPPELQERIMSEGRIIYERPVAG